MTSLRKNDSGGFTLVELIVLLVILALLAAILIPSLTGYIDTANDRELRVEASEALKAMQTIASEDYAAAGERVASISVSVSAAKGGAYAAVYGEAEELAEVPGNIVYALQDKGKIVELLYERGGREALYKNGAFTVSKGDKAQAAMNDILKNLPASYSDISAYFRKYGVGNSLDSGAADMCYVNDKGEITKTSNIAPIVERLKKAIGTDDLGTEFQLYKASNDVYYIRFFTPPTGTKADAGKTVDVTQYTFTLKNNVLTVDTASRTETTGTLEWNVLPSNSDHNKNLEYIELKKGK